MIGMHIGSHRPERNVERLGRWREHQGLLGLLEGLARYLPCGAVHPHAGDLARPFRSGPRAGERISLQMRWLHEAANRQRTSRWTRSHRASRPSTVYASHGPPVEGTQASSKRRSAARKRVSRRGGRACRGARRAPGGCILRSDSARRRAASLRVVERRTRDMGSLPTGCRTTSPTSLPRSRARNVEARRERGA